MSPRLEKHAEQMRDRAQKSRRFAGVPASFFRRSPARQRPNPRGYLHWSQLNSLKPENRGFHDGYHDLHYIPTLNYGSREDWLAWLEGWRQGQAELKAARRTQGLLL